MTAVPATPFQAMLLMAVLVLVLAGVSLLLARRYGRAMRDLERQRERLEAAARDFQGVFQGPRSDVPGQVVLPANYMKDGRMVRISASGTFLPRSEAAPSRPRAADAGPEPLSVPCLHQAADPGPGLSHLQWPSADPSPCDHGPSDFGGGSDSGCSGGVD